MANVIVQRSVEAEEKVKLMRADAAYEIMNSAEALAPEYDAVRQNIRAKLPPPTVPKVFLGNDCIFNCAYCNCRAGNECKRNYQSTPRELADLAYRQAKRNGHGIFITSAIIRNPDHTEEQIIETLRILREDMGYDGYLHAKVMPGTDPELIRRAGRYANRLSVNIEVARSEGYARIARNKNKQNILTPMEQISQMIAAAKVEKSRTPQLFATSQTTQLMAGSSEEDDYTILRLSGALYKKYALSRVYYTSFQYRHQAAGYQLPYTVTPGWRMSRLYQADRLMQLYGFSAEEIAPEQERFLSASLDPKSAWALRNLHLYPVEINKADYELLLRVPGIGITSAKRILNARKYGPISFEGLKLLGISLKRSQHFITCGGKYQGIYWDDAKPLNDLLSVPAHKLNEQLSLNLWEYC